MLALLMPSLHAQNINNNVIENTVATEDKIEDAIKKIEQYLDSQKEHTIKDTSNKTTAT